MTKVVLRPAAASDVVEAFEWYGQRRSSLAYEFLAAVDAALAEIAEYPKRNQVLFRATRRYLIRRFPYALYYRAFPQVVVVVACMHCHRNPSRWKRRTSG